VATSHNKFSHKKLLVLGVERHLKDHQPAKIEMELKLLLIKACQSFQENLVQITFSRLLKKILKEEMIQSHRVDRAID